MVFQEQFIEKEVRQISKYLQENWFGNNNKFFNNGYFGFKQNNFSWTRNLTYSNLFDITRREVEIGVIKDFLEGRVFRHWYEFLISLQAQNCPDINYEDLYKKSLVYLNLMNTLVEDISTMCPIMETFDTRQGLDNKEIEYLKEELDEIEWTTLSMDIVRDLETKGDVFFQIYYDKDLKKHRLQKLKTENMLDIIPKTEDTDIQYIYKDTRIERKLVGNILKEKEINNIIVFSKGGYTIFYDVMGLNITNAQSEYVSNTPEMGKMIPLIHIKGKRQREDSLFSQIPCVDYIDSIL